MSINTVHDLLAVVKDRGLEVRIKPGPPPMPVLVVPGGPDKEKAAKHLLATETLMECLKAWRPEIIELLSKP